MSRRHRQKISGGDPDFLRRELNAEKKARMQAYKERNQAVVAFAKLAASRGWPAGRHWDTDPALHDSFRNSIVVDLPGGQQLAWHMSLHDEHLLDDLPVHPHGRNEKAARMTSAWPDLLTPDLWAAAQEKEE